jgi:hypothetical protein
MWTLSIAKRIPSPLGAFACFKIDMAEMPPILTTSIEMSVMTSWARYLSLEVSLEICNGMARSIEEAS